MFGGDILLVHTDPKLGLTEADVMRAIRILQGEKTEPAHV